MPRPCYPQIVVSEPSGEMARELLIYRTIAELARAGAPPAATQLYAREMDTLSSYISVLDATRSWVTVLAPDQETPRTSAGSEEPVR